MTNEQQIWQEVKDLLKGCIDKKTYETEFDSITEVVKNDKKIYLLVQNGFSKWKIQKYFLGRLNELLGNVSKEEYIFDVLTKEEAEIQFPKKENESDSRKKISSNVIKPRNLRSEYTFENFVTGEANREAYTFSVKIAENPNVTINPFYIFGDVGLGKTHLMTAIGHYILDNNPNATIIYTTAQQFVEDYFKSKNKNQRNTSIADEFDNYYRSADVLLVDDVQYFADRQGSQDEFFKLFEYLFNENKQIVITSDRPASELNLMARLKSRFSWGIQTDLKKPNQQLREAIIKNKLKFLINNSDDVPAEVITYIAENFTQNVREIEGALRRLVTYCVSFNIEFTLDNAIMALEPIINTDITTSDNISNSNLEKIKETIAKYFNVNVKDLSSASRKQDLVYARSITVYILKTKYNLTLNKIGYILGGRDHATIAHAYEKIQSSVQTDNNTKEDINNLTENLNRLYK